MVFKALRLFRATKNSTPLYWLTYHLAIAPQPWRHEWQAIQEAGVRCVLDLRSQTQDDIQAIQDLAMTFRHAPIVDGEAPELATLLDITDWVLDQQGTQGPVLVHCREGRGRSAMVGCAVLIRMGVLLAEAYRAVRNARGESVSLSDEQVEALELFAKYCVTYPRWRQERGA
jgi:protein-tyrosine phosphatase